MDTGASMYNKIVSLAPINQYGTVQIDQMGLCMDVYPNYPPIFIIFLHFSPKLKFLGQLGSADYAEYDHLKWKQSKGSILMLKQVGRGRAKGIIELT